MSCPWVLWVCAVLRPWPRVVLPIALVLVCLRPEVSAQTPGATLTGEVHDESGAVIPKADLTLSDAATGVQRRAVSNDQGIYVFTGLPAGTYVLLAGGSGFAPVRIDGITIVDSDRRSLPVVLRVESIAASVTVEARDAANPLTGSTAMKVNTPLLDTPQSLTVIPATVMASQQANEITEVLKNDSSVTRQASFLGAYDSYSVRGFTVENTASFLRNGRTYFRLGSVPVELLERVEVLKGPSSVLYGEGIPGGTINFITKQPLAAPHYEVNLSVGSDGLRLGQFDAGGPIGRTRRLSYRATVAYENSDSFRDFVTRERLVSAVTLHWKPGPNHLVGFDVDRLEDDRPQDTGLVLIGDDVADVPISRFITQPWGHYNTDGWNIGGFWNHQLRGGWSVSTGVNYQDFQRDRYDQGLFGLDETTGDISMLAWRRVNRWNTATFNADVTGTHRLFGLDHQILAGLNYARITSDNDELSDERLFTTNIYNPVYYPDPGILPGTTKFYADIDRPGLYIQDVVRLSDAVSVVAGARYDRTKRVSRGPDSVEFTEIDESAWVPRLAGIVKPRSNVSAYLSYSRSFAPNFPVGDGRNAGELLDPTHGAQVEAGLKTEFAGGRLGVSAAAFRIVNDNLPYFDPDQNLTVLIGERRNRGIELSASGALARDWRLTASLTYLDAQFTRDASVQGNRPAGVPRWAGNVFTEYVITAGTLSGLAMNAGVYVNGERSGDLANSFTLDGYARWDAGLGYALPLGRTTIRWRVNAENVTDERYYFSSGRLSITPGAPRSVRTRLEWQF